MTDRELLELAAKAAGMSGFDVASFWSKGYRVRDGSGDGWYPWNPLTSDGDALRLAGALGLVVDCSRPSAGEPFKATHQAQADYLDIHAATRRAIVRAAAEIGKGML